MKSVESGRNEAIRRNYRGLGTVLLMSIVLVSMLAPVPLLAGALGDEITEFEIGCNDRGDRCREVFAAFDLGDGIEGYLLLNFAEATLLNENSLDISVRRLDPRNPEVRDRLPAETFIPDDFPVLVTIEPRQGERLSFRRNWTLELVTENLEFSAHTPYRLFRSPTGGRFQDISGSLGGGSFRVQGIGASFSEFVIAADLRPVERVIGQKLTRLEFLVSEISLQLGGALDPLSAELASARQFLEAGDPDEAIDNLDTFIDLVEANSGAEIPDDTTPEEGLIGLAARLLSDAETLRHTIFLGLESAQGGMSGFSRTVQAEGFSAQMIFNFDEAFVVDPAQIDFRAEVIGANDPTIMNRLPDGVQVPEEFPVLIRVNPRPGIEQAFSGDYEIELRTDDLRFVGDTPLRLFKAPDGGAFEDITRTFGLGSFRVQGIGASFSEFLVVEDLRSIEEIVATKFGGTLAAIRSSPIPPAVRGPLVSAVQTAAEIVGEGDIDAAIDSLEGVIEAVEEAAGDTIPASWRAGEGLENVAGELISLVETLIFSLELQDAPPGAAAGDVNRDGKIDVGDIFFLIDQVFGEGQVPAEVFLPPGTDEQQ